MNHIKRAINNVIRTKSKSILLFSLVFILGNIIAGSISIQQASKNVEKNIKTRMGAIATITIDYSSGDKSFGGNELGNDDTKITLPSEEVLKTIGSSSYVRAFDYSIGSNVLSESIKPIVAKGEEQESENADKYNFFQFKGVQYEKILSIQEKKENLVQGRVFTKQEIEKGEKVALISKKLASQNNIKVDDKVIFKSFIPGSKSDNKENIHIEDIAVKIVGIYESANKNIKNSDNKNYMDSMVEARSQNTIYVPNKLSSDINKRKNETLIEKGRKDEIISTGDANFEPIYILKNPSDKEKFISEAQPLLQKPFIIKMTSDNFEKISGPIKKTTEMANYILMVSIAASILIITLVILLFLRDRKHELGIYIALGEKRAKVFSQILIELALIAVVGILLSLFTGNMIASSLSQSTIKVQEQDESVFDMDYGSGEASKYSKQIFTQKDVVESYKVGLSIEYAVVFFVVGLLTIMLAAVAPLLYILRLNPKKIMM